MSGAGEKHAGAVADWAAVAPGVVAGLATLVWLDDVAEALVRAWPFPQGLLALVGWLPQGGFLIAMGFVALRSRTLRMDGRRFSGLEEGLYGLLGMAWGGVGFALLGVSGYKVYDIDTASVSDALAEWSLELSVGLSLGQLSWLLVPVLGVGFLLSRMPFVPKPGWATQTTVMLLLWLPAGVTGTVALGVALLA